MRRASWANRDAGAAVVEFTMVAVLLITLMISVIEGGRLFLFQATLASAARDAAREMAISGDQGEAQSAAGDVFVFGTPVWDSGNSVACPDTPAAGDDAVVSLTFDTGMMSGIYPGTFTLRGTGTMRCNG